MRLLNARTLRLETLNSLEDVKESIPGGYAILSHTWLAAAADEVSFQDIQSWTNVEHPFESIRPGFRKVEYTCEQALEDGHEHVWIDTCCIDKTNSVELSEAINSMYDWYKEAEICYAYIDDVHFAPRSDLNFSTHPAPGKQFQAHWTQHAKWFNRGWTLQELIAPDQVRFYDATWSLMGTKADSAWILSATTSIDEGVLHNRDLLSSFCIATRMSWASKRRTTRVEDRAYSLLGIFDVRMPMIYGEGSKAFLRLQEEIIKLDTDHSIFGWEPSLEESFTTRHMLFAPDPSVFALRTDLISEANAIEDEAYELSNRGLRISLPVIDRHDHLLALLNCSRENGRKLVLKLIKLEQQPRAKRSLVCILDRNYSEGPVDGALPEPLERKEIIILRESLTTEIMVVFKTSEGLAPLRAYPDDQNVHVWLRASKAREFRQHQIEVTSDHFKNRATLHFGQVLLRRGSHASFRMKWSFAREEELDLTLERPSTTVRSPMLRHLSNSSLVSRLPEDSSKVVYVVDRYGGIRIDWPESRPLYRDCLEARQKDLDELVAEFYEASAELKVVKTPVEPTIEDEGLPPAPIIPSHERVDEHRKQNVHPRGFRKLFSKKAGLGNPGEIPIADKAYPDPRVDVGGTTRLKSHPRVDASSEQLAWVITIKVIMRVISMEELEAARILHMEAKIANKENTMPRPRQFPSMESLAGVYHQDEGNTTYGTLLNPSPSYYPSPHGTTFDPTQPPYPPSQPPYPPSQAPYPPPHGTPFDPAPPSFSRPNGPVHDPSGLFWPHSHT